MSADFEKQAQLQGANFEWAQLQSANLKLASLQGADLSYARLQGANLEGAQLQGANLSYGQLIAAFLLRTRLQGAILAGAQLQGAVLVAAELQGAMLYLADLQGANLRGAQLQGADIQNARFWQTTFWEGPADPSNLGLADLRGAAWQPPEQNEAARIRENLDALKDDGPRRYSKGRLARLIAPGGQSDDPPKFALDGILLVDDVQDPRWQGLDVARLTSDERVSDEALVPFLAELARSDPHVARGLVSRIAEGALGRAARLARGLLDHAGPALPEDVRERLSRIASQPEPKD